MLILALFAQALAETPVYRVTTELVAMERWPGSGIEVTEIQEETRVEVLFEEGEQVRVREGIQFGWVPADKLKEEGSQ